LCFSRERAAVKETTDVMLKRILFATILALIGVLHAGTVAAQTIVNIPGFEQQPFTNAAGAWVVNAIAAQPDGSESVGKVYLVAPLGLGAFSGHSNEIAILTANQGWYFVPPTAGMLAYVQDSQHPLIYVGTAWVTNATGTFDAHKCGVYSDGTHDDAAALNTCLLAASQLGFSTLQVCGPTLVSSADLSIPAGITLDLCGQTVTARLDLNFRPSQFPAGGLLILSSAHTITFGAGDGSGLANGTIERGGDSFSPSSFVPVTMRDKLNLVAAFAGTAITIPSTAKAVHLHNLMLLGFTTGIASNSKGLRWDHLYVDATNCYSITGSADVTHLEDLACISYLTRGGALSWQIDNITDDGSGHYKLVAEAPVSDIQWKNGDQIYIATTLGGGAQSANGQHTFVCSGTGGNCDAVANGVQGCVATAGCQVADLSSDSQSTPTAFTATWSAGQRSDGTIQPLISSDDLTYVVPGQALTTAYTCADGSNAFPNGTVVLDRLLSQNAVVPSKPPNCAGTAQTVTATDDAFVSTHRGAEMSSVQRHGVGLYCTNSGGVTIWNLHTYTHDTEVHADTHCNQLRLTSPSFGENDPLAEDDLTTLLIDGDHSGDDASGVRVENCTLGQHVTKAIVDNSDGGGINSFVNCGVGTAAGHKNGTMIEVDAGKVLFSNGGGKVPGNVVVGDGGTFHTVYITNSNDGEGYPVRGVGFPDSFNGTDYTERGTGYSQADVNVVLTAVAGDNGLTCTTLPQYTIDSVDPTDGSIKSGHESRAGVCSVWPTHADGTGAPFATTGGHGTGAKLTTDGLVPASLQMANASMAKADIYVQTPGGPSFLGVNNDCLLPTSCNTPVQGAGGGRTLRSVGAVCNGTTNDAAAINAALAADAGGWLDGEGLTCAVSGDLILHSNDMLRNVTFKQLTPNPSGATVHTITTNWDTLNTNITLENVKVDRNGAAPDTFPSSTLDRSGIVLVNIQHVIMRNVEVFGGGAGDGILFAGAADGSRVCKDLHIYNPSVHDMSWQRASDPGAELIDGFRLNFCSQAFIYDVQVHNLLGDVTTGPYTQLNGYPFTNSVYGIQIPYQNHCVAVTGANGVYFYGGDIGNCATGTDVSGGGGAINQQVWFYGVHRHDLGDYCEKWVHAAYNSGSIGTTCENTGTILINNGTSPGDATGPQYISVIDPTVHNPGAPYCWSVGVCHPLWLGTLSNGISFTAGSYPTTQMKSVRVINPNVFDDQITPTMAHAISADSTAYDFTVSNPKVSGAIGGANFNAIPAYQQQDNTNGVQVTGPESVSGTLTANGNVQINKSIALTRAPLTLVNGDNADVVEPGGWVYNLTGPTGAFSISGFVARTGGFIYLRNSTGQPFTILNNSANSAVGNRISTATGADMSVYGTSQVCLDYNGATSIWEMCNNSTSAGVGPLATITTQAADQCPYYTSTTMASTTSCPSTGRSIMGAASASAGRITLGTISALHQDISTSVALVGSNFCNTYRVDATSGVLTETLPASGTTDDCIVVRKTDSGANRVKVVSFGGITDMAWLSKQYDEAMFAYWGGAWTPVRWSIAPLAQVFTASGTWTQPPLMKFARVTAVGGGGCGGSGRRGAAGSARSGGLGGGSGGVSIMNFNAPDLSTTETVTIGAVCTAGTAQTVDSTDGVAGGAGVAATFGAHLAGVGGPAGPAGSTAAVASPSGANGAPGQVGGISSGVALASSVTAVVAQNSPAGGPSQGGTGGGISTGNTDFSGANSASCSNSSSTPISGATGGTNGGANAGGAGTALSDTVNQYGGCGGAGGAGDAAGAGGTGGAGGAPGGGSGGGGASVNGSASGAGGAGTRGEVRVTAYF
jgi:hypothetical protein